MDLRVQKVQEIMRDNFQRKLSLGEIANSVNLSVWYLSHLFRTETGLSPIEFLRMLRMERARHLLRTTSLSVREIASNVGIHDPSHFVRDFKKRYGAYPTLYRTPYMRTDRNGIANGLDQRSNFR